MEHPRTFQHFIQTTLGVTTARIQETIHDFVDTFAILLTVTDKDIDNFVKATP